MAYVKDRYISESGRLICILNKNGFLLTVDIGEAFDLVDHSFLLAILHNYKLLDRGLLQGQPIFPFLLILALEVLFMLIKSNSNIKGLDICHNFLYTTYTNDSSFFLNPS